MPSNAGSFDTYSQVKQRLDQIVQEVGSQDISLEDALTLYEEAVKLGQRASALVEEETLTGADEESAPTVDEGVNA